MSRPNAPRGLPVGTIAEKFLSRIILGWTDGAPGALSRWMEEHFVFEGDAAEKAEITRALFRLEAQLRNEQRDDVASGFS